MQLLRPDSEIPPECRFDPPPRPAGVTANRVLFREDLEAVDADIDYMQVMNDLMTEFSRLKPLSPSLHGPYEVIYVTNFGSLPRAQLVKLDLVFQSQLESIVRRRRRVAHR